MPEPIDKKNSSLHGPLCGNCDIVALLKDPMKLKPDNWRLRTICYWIVITLTVLNCPKTTAQVDSIFWFAAPNFSVGHGDVPIYMRFTTLNDTAIVTMDQPANPQFQPINFTIPSNASYSLNLDALKGAIENDIPDVILNRGLRIRSSALINVYYENASRFNPEIFSLKGSKSLGTNFLVPMQHLFPNGNYAPIPYASFDIVATEDNTEVTIIPKHDIVGHAAGDTFSIVLNKGQTYVARAVTQQQGLHLGGSLVMADKPVAITIKDDSMASASIYGSCADLGGDQITPVNYLGKRYITVPGELNGPNDAVFIYAVKDGTQVSINGVDQGTIDRTEFLSEFSGGEPILVETSHPAYVLHMSGFGCEVGLDQMPPIDPCNGSRILSVNRSSDQAFFLNILVYNGLEGDFTFNGRQDIIESGDFTVVPGTSSNWLYANIAVALADFGVSESAIIQNTAGPFHLSVIHGGPGTGTMYGYFSDYGTLEILPEVGISCAQGLLLELDSSYVDYQWSTGDTTSFLRISRTGSYAVTVTSEHGCVASDTIEVKVLPESRSFVRDIICRDDSIEIAGQWFGLKRPEGEILMEDAASDGCDSLIEVSLEFYPEVRDTFRPALCPDDSVLLGGRWFHHGSNDTMIILDNASFTGCDSTILVEVEANEISRATIERTLCLEDTFAIHGQQFYRGRPSGDIVLEGANYFGCDSVIHIEIDFYDRPVGIEQTTICHGDSIRIEGRWFHDHYRSDTLLLDGRGQFGCDSFLVVDVDVYSENISRVQTVICHGDTFEIAGENFFQGQEQGTIILAGRDRHGCDSIIEVLVDFYPEARESVSDTLCPGEALIVGGESFGEERPTGLVRLSNASQFGCDSLIDVDVFIPVNDLWLKDTLHLRYGSTVRLEPDYLFPFRDFLWSPPDSLSCINCEKPWASPVVNTLYLLKATDMFGCPYEAQIEILIQKLKRVFIPNAITVNSDNLNDGFTAFGNYFAEEIEFMEIYNRWGSLLFRTDHIPLGQPGLGWKGTEDGQNVLPGVYTYHLGIRFLDGSVENFAGTVTVLR